MDNGSTDGCQNVATIKNNTNLGISKGKNQCIDASQGEYIILLDGDVVPVYNSLTLMLEYMDEHRDIEALGALCNKGTDSIEHCEGYCDELKPVKKAKHPCLYYGVFRRSMFEKGVRMDETGAFDGVGYGYEDHDFYNTMQKHGVAQWVAGINKETGRYYHEVNSSIRVMGRNKYVETSHARYKQLREKWKT